MKKIVIVLILILSIFTVSCTSVSDNFNGDKDEIKDTIDLVLSYKNGYDDVMKKHIEENNFIGLNFTEFYKLYIGEVDLKDYKSKIKHIKQEGDKYIAAVIVDIRALSVGSHTHDDGTVHEGGHEVNGEDIPMQITLVEKDGSLFIEEAVGYENLQKAKEINEDFR